MTESFERPMRRVALFGGSFNPPHLGHTMVTTWALTTCPVDEVWWVPTFDHAFGKDLAPFDDRLALCRLAARHFEHAHVSDIEGEMGGESRTIDTLEELSRQHPGCSFSILIGADLVETLPRWKRYEDLVSNYEIFVVGRGSIESPGASVAIPDISSTELRAALATGDDELPKRWMDAEVLAALQAQALAS